MKQELKQLLRDIISEMEFDRSVCVESIQICWVGADKNDTSPFSEASFRVLNIEKTELRRIDKKLKKLRFLQTEIKKTSAIIRCGVMHRF